MCKRQSIAVVTSSWSVTQWMLCRGKVLAAFLKSIGFIIPLMEAMYANYYTREVMVILVREFQTPDEEMKKIVLKVVKQCVGTDGVEPDYIRHEILPEFFRNFWVRRMALDRRNYRQLVETTVELANKVRQAPRSTFAYHSLVYLEYVEDTRVMQPI